MRNITILLIAVCSLFVALNTVQAQDKNHIFVIISSKTIMPEGGSAAERDSLATIFTDAVTRKNDKILSQQNLQHFYGRDSRDWITLRECATWADVEAARQMNGKLIQEAWPDEEERRAFFQELNKYWQGRHGDEMYTGITKFEKLAPEVGSGSDENHVFGMQAFKTTQPEGGSVAKRDSMLAMVHEAVVMKNDKIISQRVLNHFYGMDSRDWIVVTEYENWEAVEEARNISIELRRERWPDQEQRRAFFRELNTYWLPQHSDQIYTGLSRFEKRPAQMTAK